jgi:hypothetical protein
MADVLAILFEPARADALRQIRVRHPDSSLFLLTTPMGAQGLSGLVDDVWIEGAVRGPGRFLALLRRISWMRFAHVYDLEARPLTRFMRFCVWPRPRWHRLQKNRPLS